MANYYKILALDFDKGYTMSGISNTEIYKECIKYLYYLDGSNESQWAKSNYATMKDLAKCYEGYTITEISKDELNALLILQELVSS